VELQTELLRLAGWPDCREVYRKNLTEALSWRRYCAELVRHPERGGIGTGSDPASQVRALEAAENRVAYRRRLLEELDDVWCAHRSGIPGPTKRIGIVGTFWSNSKLSRNR
jgi:hypothetical protein